MTWETFREKNENEARAYYAELKGKEARMLYKSTVVEKDGDKQMTAEMEK